MDRLEYRRDLPDGTKQYFRDRLERPAADQLYFDDMISYPQSGAPLEFLNFGKEQSYPSRALERELKHYILHYVTDGAGEFNGRRVTAGEGFLVVPGVPHRMAADRDNPWHFKWICFSGSDARWQMKSIGLDETHPFFTFRFAEELEALVDDVLYREHGACDLGTYMQGIFYIIMSYHKKQYLNDRQQGDAASRYALEAIRYMDEHYWENLRIDEIAAFLHISRKYLCAVLDRTIGMSTKEYLLNRRVEAAATLLIDTDLTVSEIATQVGYGDYTQLSRMFRKKRGISPQQFRKQHREKAVLESKRNHTV